MAYIVLPSKGRGYELHLDLAQVSQNVALNQSTVSWILYIVKGTGSGAFTSYSCSWSSSGSSGSIGGFNFSGYSSLTLGSGTFTVTHAADGTGTANTSGSFSESDPDPELGNGTVYASLALTTIPRATQPTVSPTSGNTAATYTIGHTPAVSTFYHDVAYSLDNGATYTNIQTNIVGTDVSTDWTPAHSLIPNAGSLTAILRVITRQTSGGTIIGTKTVSLPLTVPSSVKPTISSVMWDDAQVSAPDMPALMGGSGCFVQGWSKLKPTVTSAGAGGSTVTSVAVTQNGQVTPSGTAFGLPVALSGSVPYSAIATDSRVRTSDVYANTVDVTAYNFPNLPTPTVTRTSDAGGTTPSPTGTYLAITPAASVSTLIFGAAEKNLLEWRVRIKQAGGAYSTVQDWTASTVSGNTWTTKYVAAGPYPSSNEYVVEVSIRDLFGKNGYNTSSTVVTKEITVPSEFVFMDWDGNSGIGLGGYRRYGMLDVHGDIYADKLYATDLYQGGYRAFDLSKIASGAQTAAKTDNTLVVTPLGLASTEPLVEVFTANDTWTKPTGCKSVHVIVIGGGGGGGSGRRGAAASARGGGSGGGGGSYSSLMLPSSILGSTVAVTVGAAGAGGAAVTANDTIGNPGGDGGDSQFGEHVKASGGVGGKAGNTTSQTGGAGGDYGLQTGNNGGSGAVGVAGGSVATSADRGPSGGGGGGCISTGNASFAGGAGGPAFGWYTAAAGFPAGGTTNGGAGGTKAADASYQPGYGGGGGGGGNPAGGAGGTGGAGTNYGSGGGGGGGSLNGSNSGAGGAGAAGVVVVISYF